MRHCGIIIHMCRWLVGPIGDLVLCDGYPAVNMHRDRVLWVFIEQVGIVTVAENE